jgi:hypothetical protein
MLDVSLSIMKNAILPLFFLLAGHIFAAPPATNPSASGRGPVDRVRFFPAPGHEQEMLGGKFTGSNVSERTGYEELARIASVPPAGQWSEFSWPGQKAYRWVRYEAPPGSYGRVAEIEFYAGPKQLKGLAFGSMGNRNLNSYMRAMDGNTATFFDSSIADGQFVGIDAGTWCDAAPSLKPVPGEQTSPLKVTLACDSPNAVIRYSFDGTPGLNDGTAYSGPIPIDQRRSLFAVAFREGLAPSPTASGTYLVAPAQPGLATFHVGNSLTGITHALGEYALTAGWKHDYHAFIVGGAPNSAIWQQYVMHPEKTNRVKLNWTAAMASLTRLDDFTAQVHDVVLASETAYDIKFFDLMRSRFPQMQPWLYSVWGEMFKPVRTVVLGQVPSFEMKTLYPALSWEESCASWLLYAEDVQTQVLKTYTQGKPPHILPCSIAAGWLKNLIDQGKIPGVTPADFPYLMFHDNFHPGPMGQYLVDMVWYSAFYRASPVGQVFPVATDVKPEQARALQELAWDVVRNYPDCGLYEKGTVPVSPPEFSPAPGNITDLPPVTPSITPPPPESKSAIRVTLSSSTPGAWFRYTLDGTTPTRTRGYIYCGVISVRPGMTLKAVAYKSGMADSAPVAKSYPAAP